MSKAVVVSAFLVLAACSGKKDEERVLPPEPAPVAPAPAKPEPPPTPAPPAPPALGKLTCERIVSSAIRDKYFPGKTLADQARANDREARCQMTDGGVEVVVAADCPEARTGTPQDAAKAMKDQRKDLKDLAGVGTAALIAETAKQRTVIAWDDDSACQLEVTVPKSIDAAALAKDLLAELPPKPLTPPAEKPATDAAGSAAPSAGSAAPAAGSATDGSAAPKP